MRSAAQPRGGAEHRDVREYAFRANAVREYGSTRSASTPYAFRANAVQKAPQSQG